ncbi:hypothetical protein BFG57_00485 [Bacillus solimangrovi]|uniref:Helicase Helix-turn-helix domain-containing protein n=1 Tax=Bacillus solimangrovi TaxID=1305675 RepID=A0A1E5LHF0_9BACI|nr:hypothetical protein BFG57_00485 [Bacillus solimangrovi]
MITYRLKILLFSLNKFDGERSSSGLFHLLRGKKSSQTIQDGQLFELSFLFGTMPRYIRSRFEQDIQQLIEKGYVQMKLERDGHLIVTQKGKEVVSLFERSEIFPNGLDGWQYNNIGSVFWERFSLLIQSISNLVIEQSNFIPVSRNEEVFRWSKNWFQQTGLQKKELADMLHKECHEILSTIPDVQSDIFLLRLSASHRYGLTFQQIGEYTSVGEDGARYLFQAALHQFVRMIRMSEMRTSLLYTLIRDQHNEVPLTNSTRKTFNLFEQGRTIEEIAHIRNLKLSTIEDHFIEIALNDPSFSTEPFISDEIAQSVLQLYHSMQTKRMKPIKEQLNDDVSYFQIRLIIAKGERR